MTQSVNCRHTSAVAGGDGLGKMEADILPRLGFLRQYLECSAITANQREMFMSLPSFQEGHVLPSLILTF